MKKFHTVLLLILCTISVACATDPLIITVSNTREDRQVSNFDGVATSGNINVIIKFGATESLRLEGDADAISDLITEVKGTMLNIRPKSKVYWDNRFRSNKVTAYVTIKKLNNMIMSGSGDMRVDGTVNSSKITATLSGSGTIKARVNTNSMVGTLSGSGVINLSGKAENATITVSGSGDFAARDLIMNNLSTVISGSGDVEANVSERLKAVINGSGNVRYTGDPRVEKTTVGSGRVRKS